MVNSPYCVVLWGKLERFFLGCTFHLCTQPGKVATDRDHNSSSKLRLSFKWTFQLLESSTIPSSRSLFNSLISSAQQHITSANPPGRMKSSNNCIVWDSRNEDFQYFYKVGKNLQDFWRDNDPCWWNCGHRLLWCWYRTLCPVWHATVLSKLIAWKNISDISTVGMSTSQETR